MRVLSHVSAWFFRKPFLILLKFSPQTNSSTAFPTVQSQRAALYSFSAEIQSRHLKPCAKSIPIVTTVSGYAISSRSSTGLRQQRSSSLPSLRAQFKQFLSLALSATAVSFSHAFRVREYLPPSIALAPASAAARPHNIHGTGHNAMRQSYILHLTLLHGKGPQSRPPKLHWRPRRDSNPNTRLRRPALFPIELRGHHLRFYYDHHRFTLLFQQWRIIPMNCSCILNERIFPPGIVSP